MSPSSQSSAVAPAGMAAVVIGRNEGERLIRCLNSLAVEGVPVVYVDSGSTDGSVASAHGLGVDVVELDPTLPFAAGRARNEGLNRCLAMHPTTESILFIDGDCVVEPGWLAHAQAELEARPELAVVCGRLREIAPERSVFNRLADLEWDAPLGLIGSSGGIAVFRVADFLAVGGFDPTIRAGEEPELCRRLRATGRLVARIDFPMARHDLNMTRLSQWWRRQVRLGYHGLALEHQADPPIGPDGRPMPSLFGDALRRSRVWGIGWPVAVLSGATLGATLVGPIAALGVVGLGIGGLSAQAARLAWRVRHRVPSRADALTHGALMVLDKWANLTGQVRYLLDRRADHRTQQIPSQALATTRSPVPGADA